MGNSESQQHQLPVSEPLASDEDKKKQNGRSAGQPTSTPVESVDRTAPTTPVQPSTSRPSELAVTVSTPSSLPRVKPRRFPYSQHVQHGLGVMPRIQIKPTTAARKRNPTAIPAAGRVQIFPIGHSISPPSLLLSKVSDPQLAHGTAGGDVLTALRDRERAKKRARVEPTLEETSSPAQWDGEGNKRRKLPEETEEFVRPAESPEVSQPVIQENSSSEAATPSVNAGAQASTSSNSHLSTSPNSHPPQGVKKRDGHLRSAINSSFSSYKGLDASPMQKRKFDLLDDDIFRMSFKRSHVVKTSRESSRCPSPFGSESMESGSRISVTPLHFKQELSKPPSPAPSTGSTTPLRERSVTPLTERSTTPISQRSSQRSVKRETVLHVSGNMATLSGFVPLPTDVSADNRRDLERIKSLLGEEEDMTPTTEPQTVMPVVKPTLPPSPLANTSISSQPQLTLTTSKPPPAISLGNVLNQQIKESQGPPLYSSLSQSVSSKSQTPPTSQPTSQSTAISQNTLLASISQSQNPSAPTSQSQTSTLSTSQSAAPSSKPSFVLPAGFSFGAQTASSSSESSSLAPSTGFKLSTSETPPKPGTTSTPSLTAASTVTTQAVVPSSTSGSIGITAFNVPATVVNSTQSQTPQSAPSIFGSASSLGSVFGSDPASTSSKAAAPSFNFGSTPTAASTAAPQAVSVAVPSFGFGSSAASTANSSSATSSGVPAAFGLQTSDPAKSSQPAALFGSAASLTSQPAASATPQPAVSSTGFTFGGQASAAAPPSTAASAASVFGAPTSSSAPAFSFGSAAAGVSFGKSSAPAVTTNPSQPGPSPSSIFGAALSSAANISTASTSGGIQLGTAAASSLVPTVGFGFGQTGSAATTAASSTTPGGAFSFGQAGNAATTAAASTLAPSVGFSFGQSGNAATTAASSTAPGPGFTFGQTGLTNATAPKEGSGGLTFGQSASGGGSSIFAAASQATSTGPLFGAAVAPQSSSIFGAVANKATAPVCSASNTTSASSIFGSSMAAGALGTNSSAAANVFGINGSAGTSVFGAVPKTGSGFAPNGSNPSQAPPVFGSTSSFGASAGSAAPAAVFGATSPAAAPTFGAAAPIFGAAAGQSSTIGAAKPSAGFNFSASSNFNFGGGSAVPQFGANASGSVPPTGGMFAIGASSQRGGKKRASRK